MIEIPYIHIKISIEFDQPVRFYFMEAVIRGAMGYWLKKLVCINKGNSCENCYLKRNCAFYETFVTDFNGSLTFKNINSIPHPYLLTIHKESECKASIEIIFFNKLFIFINYFIFTFIKMGEVGIGKNIFHFKVHSVIDLISQKEILDQDNQFITKCDQGLFQLKSDFIDGIDHLKVFFYTPLRLKKKGKLTFEISFTQLVKSSLIRLSLLSQIYGQYQADQKDIQLLILNANSVQTTYTDLKFKKRQRYSKTQESKMDLGGVYGLVEYSGSIQPYLSLFNGAGLFGIGKNTTFGCGRYQYTVS